MMSSSVKHSVKLSHGKAIYERHLNGETQEAIGKSTGVSSRRIQYLCAEYLKLASCEKEAKLSEQLPDSNQHSIYVLDLNTKTHQLLVKAGIKTVGDIREWAQERYVVARLGPKIFVEVQEALAEKYDE